MSNLVSSIFGGGDSPPPPAPVAAVPTREDPAIAEAKRNQRLLAGQRRGRAATIVTGGLGDTSESEIKRPTLG